MYRCAFVRYKVCVNFFNGKNREGCKMATRLATSRGVALLEFTLLLPLLLLVTIVVIDLGNLLSHYMRLQGVAHNAIRAAEGLPNLESGGPFLSTIDDDSNCSQPLRIQNFPSSMVGQLVVQNRVRLSLCTARTLDKFPLRNVSVNTWFDTNPGPNNQTVRVRIEATYQPFFTFLLGSAIRVSVDASAAYLS